MHDYDGVMGGWLKRNVHYLLSSGGGVCEEGESEGREAAGLPHYQACVSADACNVHVTHTK